MLAQKNCVKIWSQIGLIYTVKKCQLWSKKFAKHFVKVFAKGLGKDLVKKFSKVFVEIGSKIRPEAWFKSLAKQFSQKRCTNTDLVKRGFYFWISVRQ